MYGLCKDAGTLHAMKIITRGGGALIAGAVVLFATLFGAIPGRNPDMPI